MDSLSASFMAERIVTVVSQMVRFFMVSRISRIFFAAIGPQEPFYTSAILRFWKFLAFR